MCGCRPAGTRKERVNQCLTAAGAQRCPFRELLLRVGPRPPLPFPPTAPPASPINPPTPTPCCLDSTTHSILSHRVPASLRHASHPKSGVTRRRASPLAPRPPPAPSFPLPPLRSTRNPYGRQPVRLLDRLSIVLRGRGRGVPVIKADALSRWGWGWGRGSPANRQLKDSDDGGGDGFLLSLLLTFGMLNAAVKNFQKDS